LNYLFSIWKTGKIDNNIIDDLELLELNEESEERKNVSWKQSLNLNQKLELKI